jgi:hypothetical protein
VRNLAGSDLTCDGGSMIACFHKWWTAEEFHKPLKSNAALSKSPTRNSTTQSNPVFRAVCAVFKLETLKIKHKIHHVVLRSKRYRKAVVSPCKALLLLRGNSAAACA